MFKCLKNCFSTKRVRTRSDSSASSTQSSPAVQGYGFCRKCDKEFLNEKERKRGKPMLCTYGRCKYHNHPIHQACFEELEKENFNYLKTCDKTADWGDKQIICCLWNETGLPFLENQLRCKCIIGYMCKDKASYDAMRKIQEDKQNPCKYVSDEILEDEPPNLDENKAALEAKKKTFNQESFNPFEHSILESDYE